MTYLRDDDIEKPFRNVRICPPQQTSQVFVTDGACTTVNIAAPVRTEGVVLGGEVRQGFKPMWILPDTLLSVSVTNNLNTEEWGLAIPLYFADRSGAFSGGLRFGHQWGGRNADGGRKAAESVFGGVVGAKVDLSGAR
ncbi:hypothetical protein [uncultured Sphingomonas sp.]|uniref:hypothetical protein n=1 Tax=uncultured Sphingomonas sp. TaxID=158754 RepID=UPI0025E7C936|nr:hypothetical protein [uncultured Sphingomonas sp.]